MVVTSNSAIFKEVLVTLIFVIKGNSNHTKTATKQLCHWWHLVVSYFQSQHSTVRKLYSTVPSKTSSAFRSYLLEILPISFPLSNRILHLVFKFLYMFGNFAAAVVGTLNVLATYSKNIWRTAESILTSTFHLYFHGRAKNTLSLILGPVHLNEGFN